MDPLTGAGIFDVCARPMSGRSACLLTAQTLIRAIKRRLKAEFLGNPKERYKVFCLG
ncbi:hypothetical protein GCM10025762_44060 [Haloechinothrix salitolerans]